MGQTPPVPVDPLETVETGVLGWYRQYYPVLYKQLSDPKYKILQWFQWKAVETDEADLTNGNPDYGRSI